MTRETLLLATVQSGALFLAIWLIFRLVPSIPANAKAWIWRIAFLKPLASLLPFAIVTLHVLPAAPSAVVIMEGTGPARVADVAPAVAAPSYDPILVLWLLGVAGVALYGLASWMRVVRIVRHAQPVMDGSIQEALHELTVRAGVGTSVELLCSPKVPSAMLVGGFRPTIVLPTAAVASGAHQDIRLMLAHEVAHLARRDLPWFGVIWAVQSLFFFNPLAWVAARCARLDHESATDRHASHLADVPIQTYAEMLLRATVVARTPLVPGTVPMAESYRTIHRRLEAMKHFNARPTIWRKSAVAALALGTVGLLPVYQFAEAAPTPQKPQPPKVTKTDANPQVKAPKPPQRIKLISKEKGKKSKVYTIELKKDRWVVMQQGKVVQVLKTKNGRPLPPIKKVKPTVKPPKALANPLPPTASFGQGSSSTVSVGQGVQAATVSAVMGQGANREAVGTGQFSANTQATRPVSGQGVQIATGVGTSSSGQVDASSFVRRISGQGEGRRPSALRVFGRTAVVPSEPSVSMKLNNCDVREALRSHFRHSNKSYEIDVKVQGFITLSMQNVSFDAALRSMLQAVGATYRIEDGVYIVTPIEKSE